METLNKTAELTLFILRRAPSLLDAGVLKKEYLSVLKKNSQKEYGYGSTGSH